MRRKNMGKTVLTVDDSDYMREIVSQSLELGDFEVLQAINGVEALDVFKKNTVDLIVTDINMPEMDGITLITEIRKINDDVPILVLTTESGESLKKEALNAGADGWIVKPFQPAKFLSMIEEVMS